MDEAARHPTASDSIGFMLFEDPDPDWQEHHLQAFGGPNAAGRTVVSATVRWQKWWADQFDECERDKATRLARQQGFVLTTDQWRRLGFARHDARREFRRGRWSAPARGVLSPVVVTGDSPEDRRRRHALVASAEALLRSDHVVAARSAAILRGLPTLAVPQRPELITDPTDTTGRRQAAHVRCAPSSPATTGRWFGVPVLDAAHAAVDVARFSRRDGIMAADAVLFNRLATRRDLEVALKDLAGLPGIRRARTVIPLAAAGGESAFESLTRLAMLDDGFPAPSLQVRVPTQVSSYRVDMLYEDQRLIIEIDGLAKYTDAESKREKLRHARLRNAGWRVERVTWEDVLWFWPTTRARLWAALAAA